MNLCNELNVERVGDINIKKNISMRYDIDERDTWRIPFLKDLISLKKGNLGVS